MAALAPGIRLVGAPSFHDPLPWGERLRLNTGVDFDADRVVPRADWRPPSPDELRLLIGAAGTGADTGACLALFNIPQRLRTQWWALAASESPDAPDSADAFTEFARQVLEYLQFKQMLLPAACTVEVVVHPPGQASLRLATGGLTAPAAPDGVLATINLGDEVSTRVLLNHVDGPMALPIHARARAFLSACRDYPLVQIALHPGEGLWLPHEPVILDGDTRGRSDIDVQLLIRRGG
jgi:hypothetical protein